MATTSLGPSPSLPSSLRENKTTAALPLPKPASTLPSLSFLPSTHFQCWKPRTRQALFISPNLNRFSNKDRGVFALLALVHEEPVVTEEINAEEDLNQLPDVDEEEKMYESRKQPRPCELYVCNLPRSCDIPELAEMFKPYGTVLSVQVSKDPETGVSRGCGYVTMGCINSARKAILALDGSDAGGREMRVRYSAEMGSGNERRNPDALNSASVRTLFYEGPHKLYVGNLAWSVRPEDLKKRFSQFGPVLSARVLYDRKEGKRRAYGFLSFDSAKERDDAVSLNGKEFRGRVLAVRAMSKTSLAQNL